MQDYNFNSTMNSINCVNGAKSSLRSQQSLTYAEATERIPINDAKDNIKHIPFFAYCSVPPQPHLVSVN